MFDKKALAAIPGVSPLAFSDEQLFRAAFPMNEVRYASSWLYILRAAHTDDGGLGYKYVSQELVAVIGYRHEHLYITPLFDVSAGLRLKELCDRLIHSLGCQVILKKVELRKLHGLKISSDEASRLLPLEDGSTQETVLQLQKLFVGVNGEINLSAKKLARRAESFARKNMDFQIIEDIKEIPTDKMKHFLARDPEKEAHYSSIIEYLYSQENDPYKYRVMIFMHRGRVRGLYVVEVLSLTEVGLYSAVTSKDVGGITEWMDIYFFKKLFLEGVQTVHLGGAENTGIAAYIDKLLPYQPIYSTHTIAYRPSADVCPARSIVIRQAEETDFNELAILYRDLYNSLGNLNERWTKESAHRFVSHFYRRQSDLFLVAEYKGRLIGGVVAAVQPWWDGNHLVEGELFIDKSYESTDVSKKLLKALLTKARDTYQTVAWDTLTPALDEHPLGLYEQVGFTEVPEWVAVTGDVHGMLQRLGT